MKGLSLRSITLSMIAIVSLLVVTHAHALTRVDKLKATYLYNFTKYIEWPEREFFSEDSVIRLCVIADAEFTAFIKALVKNRQVGKQKRMVEVIDAEQAASCHMSFFQHQVDDLLPACSASLIVAADPSHNVEQAAITFFQQDNKLRFEINMRRATERDVSFSSELLKLARITNN